VGAALEPCGALGPTHGERGGVRRLGTNGAAENRGGVTATAYRRWTRRGCGRDAEVAAFYSRALCRSNAGLCKERGREVMAQCGSRAGVLTHAARRSSDATVAMAMRGGDAERVLSVRWW
jgi:hypothetical protein